MTTNHTTSAGTPSRLPLAASDPLWGEHPLVSRLGLAGQRLRTADRDHPWALDTAVVVAVFLLFCVPDLVHGGGPSSERTVALTRLPLAGMLALQTGLVLPLLGRRRTPAGAFTAIAAVLALQWSLGAWLRADVAVLIALYSLALYGRLRHLPWACTVMAGALALVAVRISVAVSVWDALFFLFSTPIAAVALGLAVRIRRAQLAGLRERATRLEIERDQRTKLTAATERTRVAREMHDIVGHHLSVMITLADAGGYAAHVTPQRGKEALGLIADTGRQALGELRRMLDVLRDQADPPELNPQPGIADIAALCTRIRAAGPQIIYRTTGNVDALDRSVQLTVYRIVQEALTNTLKHAGADTQAQLVLTVAGTDLRIHVQDTGPSHGIGPPGPPNEEGNGLVGMTERAALYGGTVHAGPRPGGGWTVQATLNLTPLPDPQGAAS